MLENEHHGGTKQASWLVVDELNRSEIDKVFGDLFTVFGSDDLDKRKLPLWFENDPNKQLLYVPRRYRIIGLMNNVDKNYVLTYLKVLLEGLQLLMCFLQIRIHLSMR